MYVLVLKSGSSEFRFDLHEKKENELFDNYKSFPAQEVIKNDLPYIVAAEFNGINQPIMTMYINDEEVDDKVFIKQKAERIFCDCFGVVKIEVDINSDKFVTENIRIMVKDSTISRTVVNMIDYIYNNCDNYLYEEHKSSRIFTGVMSDERVSLETKLALLDKIYDTYVRCFETLRNAPQTKSVETCEIDDFSKLKHIGHNTMQFIACHPEELRIVNSNTGIFFNKQYYQPQRTLIDITSYSCDIYENKVVVFFIKKVLDELGLMKKDVDKRLKKHSFMRRDDYFDSSYYIFSLNCKLLEEYKYIIENMIRKFETLFLKYRNILPTSEYIVNFLPRYTNIFRQIAPYNAIFQKIYAWFKCGVYDLTKSNLLLSFINTSKIYEYYCLIKLNKAIENNGFHMSKADVFQYKDTPKDYTNTLYNNTFIFEKNNISTTVFFQPVIYGKKKPRQETNGILLFRNTKISISPKNSNKIYMGSTYCPDYIIKISENNSTKYLILDAKFSTSNTIKINQLPELVFKYIFSLSPITPNDFINGMYIFCGKSDFNSEENIYNFAEEVGISIIPEARIIQVSGQDVNDNMELESLIKRIVNEN